MSDNIPGKVSVMTTAVIWAQDEHLTDMGQYLVNPSVTTFQGENIGDAHTPHSHWSFFETKLEFIDVRIVLDGWEIITS